MESIEDISKSDFWKPIIEDTPLWQLVFQDLIEHEREVHRLVKEVVNPTQEGGELTGKGENQV